MALTREQAAAEISRRRGGSVPLPFSRMLDLPDLAAAVAAVGEEIRFRAPLPARVREFLTLATAAACGCEYEWNYHSPLAAEAGLTETEIAGARDATVPLDDVLAACRELVVQIMAEKPDDVVPPQWPLDREALLNAVVLVGYYRLLASILAVGGD